MPRNGSAVPYGVIFALYPAVLCAQSTDVAAIHWRARDIPPTTDAQFDRQRAQEIIGAYGPFRVATVEVFAPDARTSPLLDRLAEARWILQEREFAWSNPRIRLTSRGQGFVVYRSNPTAFGSRTIGLMIGQRQVSSITGFQRNPSSNTAEVTFDWRFESLTSVGESLGGIRIGDWEYSFIFDKDRVYEGGKAYFARHDDGWRLQRIAHPRSSVDSSLAPPLMAAVGDVTSSEVADAMLVQELRGLVTAQESYYADFQRYAESSAALGYTGNEQVRFDLFNVSSSGWHGLATQKDTNVSCAIFLGSGRPTGIGNGVPTCGDHWQGVARDNTGPGIIHLLLQERGLRLAGVIIATDDQSGATLAGVLRGTVSDGQIDARIRFEYERFDCTIEINFVGQISAESLVGSYSGDACGTSITEGRWDLTRR